jgi:hypothetical protein
MQSAWNKDGTTFTGFQDGSVFEFRENKAMVVHKNVHDGVIDAIKWHNGQYPIVCTGGRDGKICLH